MSHYSPIVAALVTMLLTAILLHSRFGKEIQDIPNERSLHVTPVPRTGGVALMAGLLSGWALMIYSLKWWLVLPLLGLFVVSLLDDIYSLPVKKRFIAHTVAAAILVGGSGLLTQHGILLALLILLLTIWMTNLYNFMDGSDGLAGGMALFGFTFYGIASLIAHDDNMAMLNFSIGAASLGFLHSNFHPAKIFMGDAGSIPLGFLASGIGMWGWQLGYWSAWFPLLVFSPFIVDASVTLAKRTVCGVKITEAHREHYYQRAIQLGWGHRNVALIEYALMLATGSSALWALGQALPWQLFLVWAAIYAILMLVLDARWNSRIRDNNAV
jgi:UDP-N-acetylmuramyl pentapeptide phosphotransferase/UDP-N-acetylglucosamine-1-phosphate transferase